MFIGHLLDYTNRIVAMLTLARFLPGRYYANDQQIEAKHRRLEVSAKEWLIICIVLVEKLREMECLNI